jgi:hypothetical protein
MKTIPLLALLVAACAHQNAVVANPESQTCVGRRILAVSNSLSQSIDVYVSRVSGPSLLLGPVGAKHTHEFVLPDEAGAGAYARPTDAAPNGQTVARTWRPSSEKSVRFDFKCAAV